MIHMTSTVWVDGAYIWVCRCGVTSLNEEPDYPCSWLFREAARCAGDEHLAAANR